MIVPQGRIVQLPGIGDRRVKGSGGGLRKVQGRRTLMMGWHIWIVGHHQFGMVGILSSSRRSKRGNRGTTSSKGLDSTAQTQCHQYHHQDENPPNHYHHPHDHFFPDGPNSRSECGLQYLSLFRCLCLSVVLSTTRWMRGSQRFVSAACHSNPGLSLWLWWLWLQGRFSLRSSFCTSLDFEKEP